MQDTLEIVKKAEELVEKQGDIQAAIDILENQIGEIEKDPMIYGIDLPTVYKYLGIYYGKKGEYEKADNLLQEGLAIAKRDDNITEISDIYASLAFLELKTGELHQALKYASKAEDIIGEKRGFRFARARANTFLALRDIQFRENNIEKALEYHKKVGISARSIKLKGMIVQLRLDIVDMRIKEGNFIMAGLRLDEIIKDVKRNKSYPLSRCYLMLAKLDAARKQPKYAEDNIKLALEYAQEDENPVHIGECYEAMGDLKKDKEYYEEAIRYYQKAQLIPKVEEVEQKIKG